MTHKGNGHTLWEDATAVVPHQDLQLNGNTLTLSNDPTPQGIDLSPYLGNTSPQDLTLSGTVLSLTQSSQTVDLANIISAPNSNWTRDASNNELYPNNISDEVGVGTQDPVTPLHIRKVFDSVSFDLYYPTESELLTLENKNSYEGGYQSVSISLNGLYNDAKIIGGNEDFYGSDGYLAINTATNGSSTEKFRITANGNIGMGTASPKNNLDVENNVAIGQNYSGSKDAPVNGLLVEGSTRMGISNSYMNNFASVSQPSEQLWVNVSPSNTSYNYGILNTMHTTHNNDKYGIYNHTGEEGLGHHYGLHSVTNGNYFSSNQVFGISSIINHKGTGSSYGMYVENNSTGTGTSYGLYIENNASGPAGSGDEYGLYVENAEKNYIDGSLKVVSNIPGQSSNINSYVTLIENTYNAQPSSTSYSGNAPNGLAIKLGTSSPNRHANYITFFNSN